MGFAVCYSCYQTCSQVSAPCKLVVPISLSRVGEQWHHVLRTYKSAAPLAVRQRFRVQLAATLGRFLEQHRHCIEARAGLTWDCITVVPSSQDRTPPHPLLDALSMITGWDETVEDLLAKGDAALGHNHADDRGYKVTRQVQGQNVLLVDDTFTTGARMQSAASALTLSGATVVAGVCAARVVNPDYNDVAKLLWDTASRQPFSFDVCCLEG